MRRQCLSHARRSESGARDHGSRGSSRRPARGQAGGRIGSLSNPRDLLFLLLGELLWVERTLAFEALPKLIDEVRDEELRGALAEHLEQTRYHAARVEQAFRAAGAEPLSARSAELAGALQQHGEQQVTEPTLRDLFHALGAARAEHLELGLYDAVLLLASGEAVQLLTDNRADEEKALKRLDKIAERLRTELPG